MFILNANDLKYLFQTSGYYTKYCQRYFRYMETRRICLLTSAVNVDKHREGYGPMVIDSL